MAKTPTPPTLKAYAGRFASLGGKARAKKLSAEERSAIATYAVKTRWARARAEIRAKAKRAKAAEAEKVEQ